MVCISDVDVHELCQRVDMLETRLAQEMLHNDVLERRIIHMERALSQLYRRELFTVSQRKAEHIHVLANALRKSVDDLVHDAQTAVRCEEKDEIRLVWLQAEV